MKTHSQTEKTKPKKISRYFSDVMMDYIDVVELQSGKKMLKNTSIDYVYGMNRKIFTQAARAVNIGKLDNIVLIGLGDGAIIRVLRNTFKYKGHIVVLELDQALIDIAHNDFGLKDDTRLKIIQGDGTALLPTLSIKNDLVIVNLFAEPFLNRKCFTIAFWDHVLASLSKKGNVLFNTNSTYTNNINHIIGFMNRKGFSTDTIQAQGFQDIYVWKQTAS